MFRGLKYGILFLAAAAFVAGCQDKTIIPEDQPQPGEKVYTGCIPEKTDHLPRLNLQLPQDWELDDIRKEVWTNGCSVSIQASVNGQESTVFTAQGVKVKGRGNSTYKSYPKKPLTLHFFNQVNFIGTGKTKHWVLLANWMDRTLLRNDPPHQPGVDPFRHLCRLVREREVRRRLLAGRENSRGRFAFHLRLSLFLRHQ